MPSRRPFEGFAREHGLRFEEGGRVLRGAWNGLPVEVRIDASRVVVACRIASAVEASFPHSARGLLSHIRDVERGAALPTPSLRDEVARAAQEAGFGETEVIDVPALYARYRPPPPKAPGDSYPAAGPWYIPHSISTDPFRIREGPTPPPGGAK